MNSISSFGSYGSPTNVYLYDSSTLGYEGSTENSTGPSNLNFRDSLVQGITSMLVTELGDKTFFLAAILAMRYSRINVFLGTMSSLILMTVVSGLLGYGITSLIPPIYTFYASVVIMFIFGFKMLWDAYRMKPTESEDLQKEVEEQIIKTEKKSKDKLDSPEDCKLEIEGEGLLTASASKADLTQVESKDATKNLVTRLFDSVQMRKVKKVDPPTDQAPTASTPLASETSIHAAEPLKGKERFLESFKVFINAFGLIFVAEWGDRSQIATIVLASVNNVAGIIVGCILGHLTCTCLAVLAGAIVAKYISVRAVTVIGGIVFLSFAIATLVLGLKDDELTGN